MRDLPRIPQDASVDEKIRIIYDWLYEWSKTNKGFTERSFASEESQKELSASETEETKVK